MAANARSSKRWPDPTFDSWDGWTTPRPDQYRYRCRALIFPGEDDFGIAPVEAMAAGRPVIAYAAGGALDTVAEGASGLFFREPSADSLAEAVLRFQAMKFDPASIQATRPAVQPGALSGEVFGICG